MLQPKTYNHLFKPSPTFTPFRTNTFMRKRCPVLPSFTVFYSRLFIRRGLCSKLQLTFNHNRPVLTLNQMIAKEMLEFDYPIFWTKSMKLMEEMKNFTHFEGTLPLSRMKKKEKYLLDLIDNYKKFFSLILKNPLSYDICVYFCKTRIELNSLVILKMSSNYSNRFLYYHRVFLRLEKDLLCSDKIDFLKFDFHSVTAIGKRGPLVIG